MERVKLGEKESACLVILHSSAIDGTNYQNDTLHSSPVYRNIGGV